MPAREGLCQSVKPDIFIVPYLLRFFSCFPNFCFLFGELQCKCQREGVCKSVKPPALQLGLLFYVEGFSRFSAYKRHIFYAGTRLRPRGLQIEYSRSFSDLPICNFFGSSHNPTCRFFLAISKEKSWDASLSLILTLSQTSLFATSLGAHTILRIYNISV